MMRAILRNALWLLAAAVLLGLMLHAKVEARGIKAAIAPAVPAGRRADAHPKDLPR